MNNNIHHGENDLKYNKWGVHLILRFCLRGVMLTAESEFSNFMIEYLGKIEPVFK